MSEILILKRFEDIGIAREKIRKLINHPLFNQLSKHDTIWKHENDEVYERLDDLRGQINYIYEEITDVQEVLDNNHGSDGVL